MAGMQRELAAISLVLALVASGEEAVQGLCLWYPKPATKWEEALPVGNGRLGAMVFGGVEQERIQFNEHTVWTGRPRSYANDGAAEHLGAIRGLLQEMRQLERQGKGGEARAKQKAAEDLALREFMSEPLHQKAYQPCGDLWLEFDGHAGADGYRRQLDLDRAVASTVYQVGGTTFRREVFASHPAGVLVVRVAAGPGGARGIDCRVRLDSPHRGHRVAADGSDRLTLDGQVEEGGIAFRAAVEAAVDGGRVEADGAALRVSGARVLTLRLAAATNFKSWRELGADPAARCGEVLAGTRGASGTQLLEDHLRDHRALFRRVSLDVGRSAAAELPTDERIARFRDGGDPQLAALAFQYGRYLLIASSREGGQPANLQGIWNQDLRPAWDSKYTCNINTEMNYWPALVGNLAECQAPLADALAELAESGRETARKHYAAPGWVLHHNFDLWRGTAPINASDHGIWQTGGAWLALHLWEQFLFTRDRQFLDQRAWPVLRGAAEFFLATLFEDPLTGHLVVGPSNSPEQGGLVMGPTMDHQIVRSLLRACAGAADVLGRDPDFAARCRATAMRVAPNLIGRHGQLQEWLEDKDDPRNQHRHVSHLWGVYPGADVTWLQPELFDAARQSLRFRGDEATGWSMGWKINLWARFLDGDHAWKIVGNLLRPVGGGGGGMYPNLFDAHPPFQIDGNFGFSSGVAEMLVQSHLGDPVKGPVLVHLLPALPSAWPAGTVSGLRARGGFTVDVAWRDGALAAARITSDHGLPLRVKLGAAEADVPLRKGETATLDGALKVRGGGTSE